MIERQPWYRDNRTSDPLSKVDWYMTESRREFLSKIKDGLPHRANLDLTDPYTAVCCRMAGWVRRTRDKGITYYEITEEGYAAYENLSVVDLK